ncbi:thiamine-binding protein [Streptodolium elevatio]
MRLKMEFTTEPFEMPDFPPHAVTARRIVDEAGLEVEVGPFGTSAVGDAETVLAVVDRLFRDTFAVGATRISVQVTAVPGGTAEQAEDIR